MSQPPPESVLHAKPKPAKELELVLADEHMPEEISQDTRWLINAISVAKDLEHRLPLMDSIPEIENMRQQAAGIAKWAEAKPKSSNETVGSLIKELHNWG